MGNFASFITVSVEVIMNPSTSFAFVKNLCVHHLRCIAELLLWRAEYGPLSYCPLLDDSIKSAVVASCSI